MTISALGTGISAAGSCASVFCGSGVALSEAAAASKPLGGAVLGSLEGLGLLLLTVWSGKKSGAAGTRD